MGSSEDMPCVILGTGCAEPSKHRCSSGIYLGLATGGMLLDVGEDTLPQLQRHFGPIVTPRVIGELWLIWISHKHADHLLGLLGILSVAHHWKIRSGAPGAEPLLVIGPSAVRDWLREACRAMGDKAPAYNFVHAMAFNEKRAPARARLLHPMTGLTELESVPVEHCFEVPPELLVILDL